MTDEEEFCPLPAQMDAGRRRMDITLSPPANGPRSARQGPRRHVVISQCWLRRRLVEDRGVGKRDVGRQTCLLIRRKSMRLAST